MGVKKEGIALPDLPDLPPPPKAGLKAKQPELHDMDMPPKPKKHLFSIFKKKPKEEPMSVLPEPPKPDLNELSRKIEKVKQDFDRDEVPLKMKEEKGKAAAELKKKQKEISDTERLLREKDVLLTKKEKELSKWEEQLKKHESKVMERERDSSGISSTADKMRKELEAREKELAKRALDLQAKQRVSMQGTDQDAITVLKKLDSLLEQLPDSVVREFSKSKDFALYEKVMKKQNFA